MIALVSKPIDTHAIQAEVQTSAAGAVVMFLGTTREFTHGRQTTSLDYECYPEMAERKLAELEVEARRRWPILDCAIVHRLGRVEIGEASVAIAVSAAHRQPAFEAGQWLIDTLKEVVPIWKCEHWADGTTEWVHPGTNSCQTDIAHRPAPTTAY
jgi:molybdopterin synthase catalytic subunit